MTKLNSKISQAKAKLLVDYPLFGTIASKIELILNDDIQAFKSDGIKLEYNSDFIESLSIGEMEFVFANGAMHASLAHESRKNNRSGWLWQMATDLAINDMLVQNGMDRPDLAQYRKRFEGMYAEEIYAELKSDMLSDVNSDSFDESSQGQELNGLEESSLCSSSDQEPLEQNNNQQLQEEITDEIQQAQQLFEEFANTTLLAEEKNGDLPLHVERFFTLTSQGSIDWREELKYAIDRFYKDDYTLMPPNKKFLYAGIYLPSSRSERFKLVVAVDSSGSVDEELLNTFLSELNFLMSTIPNYEIDLLVCDDKINEHKTFYSGDTLELNLSGGGGTDFRPVFSYIDENLQDTKLLLYFSDLDGLFPREFPNYDVKWIVPKEEKIPFGELIVLS